MIKKATRDKKIHNIQVAIKAPTTSYLFFADDNLHFSRANSKEAVCIMGILSNYQASSRQVVNLDKLKASFI